jgi:hypothetical protein
MQLPTRPGNPRTGFPRIRVSTRLASPREGNARQAVAPNPPLAQRRTAQRSPEGQGRAVDGGGGAVDDADVPVRSGEQDAVAGSEGATRDFEVGSV